jgi:hypothetical protein
MADAKKLLGGLGKVSEKLLASGDELTAAQRAEAGRKAAALIKSQEQVKASEALGQLMEKGVKRTTTTQADRTRVGGGNIGGASFPAISQADPAYKGKVWGVMDEGTAARLKNLTTDDTAWTTMLGSANQLKTNPLVFDKLKRGFISSMKEGNLSDELAGKINHNLALTFGEGADIRDPKIWREANTFEKRAALADVMMGQGIAPSKGGVAIGGEKSGKGVIFKPTDILKRETEPSLLHTEHGGDVPTFAAGPRLFKIEKESEFNPSLHPGFPTLLKGEDYGINMKPTPTEVYLPDWHKKFKKDNPDRKSPGYYDLALGVKGEGLPSQDLHDEYIRHLLREGFKKGGKVDKVDISAADRRLAQAVAKRMSGGGMAKGGSVDIKSADARLQAAIDARMGMAQGGEAGFKKIQFMADGGKLVKGLGKIGKKLLADEAPKATAPAVPRKVSAGDVVNGMLVRKDIPNQSSIGASLYDYSTHGVQEVPMSAFETVGKPKYRSVQEEEYTKELARQIQENKELNPLIVVKDSKGHYILEGAHRFDALRELGIDSFPALMVHDLESLADVAVPAVTKAEGGGAFKKLNFMADGGKLVKGAAQIGKRLMADNSLPALEREANLKKFLEPSKTPMRLYHGTTATEGGKRNEAIRRIKPSKEGALGSGVYMTPKPNYASNYALDHMTPESYASSMGDAFEAGNVLPVHAQIRNPLIIGDTGERIDPAAEALMKLGMDKEKAQMMVERLYEDKGNIGKQIQTRAQAQGYDGLMLYHTDGELGEVVSYHPSAVKSAIGNEGTYDIRQPDLSKAEGGGAFKKLQFMDKGGKVGKVASGISSVGKRLLADPEKKIIEPPSIIIPSKVSNVKDAMRKRQGEFGARRVERAADEVPNLEKMYQEEALKQAFGGDNAKAMMTINPKDFEKYAMPLPMNLASDKAYYKQGARNPTMREAFMESGLTNEQWHELNDIQKMDVFNAYSNKVSKMAVNEPMEFDQYLKHLADLDDGFEDVPFLQINKQEQGLPLMPFISGHEGRHRNRALAGRGEEKSLVQLLPRAELREPFPRRSQEEYLEALKKELEMTGNMVRPEAEDVYGAGQIQQIKRKPIALPDVYAEGGGAFKTLQFKDAQHFDGGGIAIPEMNNSFEGSRREPLLTEKDWANIKRNAPEVYDWAKQNVKDEASQLKSARGVKDFALRTGAQYLGGIPDLINLGLMGVDAVADTNLSSEKPWFGSEQYIEALKKSGAVGENEFPIAETVAGILAPAGLIKKGAKKLRNVRSKEEPKKRRGGLTAMSR